MLDEFARFILAFSHHVVIIPLLVLGYVSPRRTLFLQASCLLLLSMLFNFALKISFRVPLAPALGAGFAFPSGHMQTAWVLYMWLAINLKRPVIWAGVAALLVGTAWGLVHFDYHNWTDILGAMFFGSLVLWSYKRWGTERGLLISSTALLLYAALMPGEIRSHIWVAYYTLLGLLLGNRLYRRPAKENVWSRLLAAALWFGASISLTSLYHLIDLPVGLAQTQWFLLGTILVLSPIWSVSILKKIALRCI